MCVRRLLLLVALVLAMVAPEAVGQVVDPTSSSLSSAVPPTSSAATDSSTTTPLPLPPSSTNTTTNATKPNFGGIMKIASPPVIWQFKPRYPLGSKIPIEWTYDALVTNKPQSLGIVVAPHLTPNKHIVLTLNQSGTANFTWDTSLFADKLSEGWWILKIWDMRNGDEKKGPITAPTEAGYVRPYVGSFNPFGLYTASPYVNDPDYCPLCSAGQMLSPSRSLLLILAVLSCGAAVIRTPR